MLTKILTAIAGLILALIVVRFLTERASRAQLRARSDERQRDATPKEQKPARITTLEIDPATGVYRPKG
jgi:hypothetical protein